MGRLFLKLFPFAGKRRAILPRALFALVLSLAVFSALPSQPSYASAGATVCAATCTQMACFSCCTGCQSSDVDAAQNLVTNGFQSLQQWIVSTWYNDNILPALRQFTEQMTAVAMYQAMIIGTFFDAKHHLETQRLLQEMQAQAHKDYQPSEDFCWFGTAARGLAASEQLGRFNSVALSAQQMGRQLGNKNIGAAESAALDKGARWTSFVTKYCDPRDNNWESTKSPAPGTGLEFACRANLGGANRARMNIDIDYTRAIEEPRTLNVNFANGGAATNAEEDVIALSDNLYGHNVLLRHKVESPEEQLLYFALRSVAAKRSVAQNSFNSIVSLKSSGTSSIGPGAGAAGTQGTSTNRFLGAIMAELGVPVADIYTIIGNDPSYYAQLEILAKKIYQNPDFYANLYDKPANVARKGVALKAIELMLDRAIYESQLRQEMATSVLLSAKLHKPFKAINNDLSVGSE